MAIKVKAVERNVSFDKNSEKWAYVMQTELYSRLSSTKVIQEAALRSGISKGAVNAAWEAIGDVIKTWATEGHSVEVPGLGTMRFGVRAKAVENVNDVSTKFITTRRVIFTPNTDIKQELADTSISITCYDRKGNVVKQVTSDDSGEVEDNGNSQSSYENDNENENSGNSGTDSGSTSTGTDSGNSGTNTGGTSSGTVTGDDGSFS